MIDTRMRLLTWAERQAMDAKTYAKRRLTIAQEAPENRSDAASSEPRKSRPAA